ncbi:hypothetical protein HK407_03g05960 [Ordospora pajunii]|uniref:uncharacterized protein n=1 Tax=Ordospora pajunii TaxID=3039483 RepID=UPI0029526F11|nr:uncharacterized protein HK407_03g05960 [Ordospora pajunii]KAH9411844.1 hypothetical protein HK407_03g05960 [Ordospora pajunii]
MKGIVAKILMFVWPLIIISFLATPVAKITKITGENPKENPITVWIIVAILCIPSALAILSCIQNNKSAGKDKDKAANNHYKCLGLISIQLVGIACYIFTTYRCLYSELKISNEEFVRIIKYIAILSGLKYLMFLSMHNRYAFVNLLRVLITVIYLVLSMIVFGMVDDDYPGKNIDTAINSIQSTQLTAKNIGEFLGDIDKFQKKQEQILQNIDTSRDITPSAT